MQKPTDNPCSLGELRTQMCERLDEQWLMLQQLTRCMQETSRQLSTLTVMVDYRCSQHEQQQQQQQQQQISRPLRFNPQMQSSDETGSFTSISSEATIALRAPLHIKERPLPPPSASKRRTAPLSINKMMKAAMHPIPPPPAEEPSPPQTPMLMPMPMPMPMPPMPPMPPKKQAKKDSSKSVLELTRMFEHQAISGVVNHPS